MAVSALGSFNSPQTVSQQNEAMKQTLFTSNTLSRRMFVAVCGAAVLAGSSLSALAQSVGVHFVNPLRQ
jgi:hypothetical protein